MNKTEGQGGKSSMLMRDYRKGNWTMQETMVLIEAKKMDEERRMKRHGETSEGGGGGGGRSKPTELRWKWVEDYCWRKGCFRSQNQCNDKWDNLLRDFKKVRDYERTITAGDGGDDDDQQKGAGIRDVHGNIRSYWKLEKSERKEKGLPSNMLPEIYEALVGVVERKAERTTDDGGSPNPNVLRLLERSAANVLPSLPSAMRHHPHSAIVTTALQHPPPPPPQPPSLPCSLPPLPTVDSDSSERSDSPGKSRRRRRRRRGEGSSGGGAGGGDTAADESVIGSAICKSASIIAEAIQEREEREERRHRELMRLQERRLEVEETNAENSRRIVHGVVEAINKLSNSVFALASHKHKTAPK